MARTIADRTKETSTTTGTGTLDLDGAVDGFQGFVAAVGGGAEVYYTIVQQDPASNNEWETGIGTVTSGSPDTLSRDTVISSSNAGSLVSFSAGTKDVFISVPHTGGPVVVDTAAPSGVASVDLALPDGFSVFKLHGWLSPDSDDNDPLWLRVSSDNGSTFDTNNNYGYANYRKFVNATDQESTSTAASAILLTNYTGIQANEFASIDLTITTAKAAVETRFKCQASGRSTAGDFYTELSSGFHTGTTPLTHIRLRFETATNNIDDGALRLIGIP